jgi:hypothetical protein
MISRSLLVGAMLGFLGLAFGQDASKLNSEKEKLWG